MIEHLPLARVVELVDSPASGAGARKGVRVRLPPRAPQKNQTERSGFSVFLRESLALQGFPGFPSFLCVVIFYAFLTILSALYHTKCNRLSPYDCADNGRPGADPVVLIKMVLIQQLYEIPH